MFDSLIEKNMFAKTLKYLVSNNYMKREKAQHGRSISQNVVYQQKILKGLSHLTRLVNEKASSIAVIYNNILSLFYPEMPGITTIQFALNFARYNPEENYYSYNRKATINGGLS